MLMFARHRDVGVNTFVHLGNQPIQVAHAAVVREIKLLWLTRHYSVDRLMRLHGVELNRCRRRKNDFAPRCIKFPVRDAKTVAREHAFRLRVIEHIVMARVALSVDRLHRAAVKIEPLFIVGNDDPALIDSFDASIDLRSAFFAVNGFGSGHELCRIDHVWRSVRVQDTKCIGQLLHQQAGTTGVVEMNVR